MKMSSNNIESTGQFNPPAYGMFETGVPGMLPAGSRLPGSSIALFVSLGLVMLAFIPLVPPVDVLEGGGVTLRGGIEFGLILIGILTLAVYAQATRSLAFDLTNPAFVILSLFVFWAVLSSIWSPNPVLTIAKSAELWLVALAAAMCVAIASRANVAPGKLEAILALALIAVIIGLIVANLSIWGTLLPNTGDVSLPLELMDEEASTDRPRLILAYAHPLLTGDLLSLTVICVFAASIRKFWKVILIPAVLCLLWLANARGPIGGVLIAMIAMTVIKLRRNDVRAVAVMLVISAILAVALVVNDSLIRMSSSLMTEDVSTLNSRTELWKQAFVYIVENPVAGCGYYASRYLLIKNFSWAGHAHNSFIETLLTTGLIGLTVLLAFLAYLARVVLRSRNAFLPGVIIYCLIQGMLNPLLFYAGLPMFVIMISVLLADTRLSAPNEDGLSS
jgi:O-antigen ligase